MVDIDLSAPQIKEKNTAWALDQLKICEDNGMDGLLIEFRGGGILEPKLSEDKIQYMNDILKKVITKSSKVVVGVEILWHYPEDTLRLAKLSGAKFVRLDFFSDQVIADKKKVPIDPKALVDYKNKIQADDVSLLTDIQVKYSEMVDKKITITQSAKLAAEKGSKGVVVTSHKSGVPPETKKVEGAKKGVPPNIPVIIGSGFSKESAKDLLKFADAVIVGTSISEKTGGPLIPEKVKDLVQTVNKIREDIKLKK